MLEKVGGWPAVRGALYGLALVVCFVLSLFGIVTADQAAGLAEQVDRVLLVVGSLIGTGIGGLALRNIEKAPDAPKVIDQDGADVPSRVESKVDGLAGELSRIRPVLDLLGSLLPVVAGMAGGDRAEPTGSAGGSDAVTARRRELERRVASGGGIG